MDGKKTRALSYDIMKRRLDKGLYTRLDHFQEDIFSVFERARRCSKLDSRTYLDAITLQTEYMKIRSVQFCFTLPLISLFSLFLFLSLFHFVGTRYI